MSTIVKIPIDRLDEGMIVVKFDKGGFSFPHYGKPFPDKVLKQYLMRNGVQFVFIKDMPKAEMPPVTTPPPYVHTPKETEELKAASPSLKEIQKAVELHDHAKTITTHLLDDARIGKVVDSATAKTMVSELVEHCVKSPEAFVNMSRLKDYDNYTFNHSVNVSVLSIAIGKRLGMSASDMNNLGFAGLLHDIGKMMLPGELVNKPGKLTDEEFALMKNHPLYGYEYLKKDPTIPEDVLMAVKYHHEKSDGTGYPDGLLEKNIPKYAKIVSIADVYDAVTTERSYHKGIVPSDALKMIFGWSGKHFNNALVKFFISIMGIHPVGTLVILNTNELAVILEPNKNDPMRPKVIIISNSGMEPIRPIYFDLVSYNVITKIPYKSIVSSLDPRDFSIDTNKIIDQYIKIYDSGNKKWKPTQSK